MFLDNASPKCHSSSSNANAETMVRNSHNMTASTEFAQRSKIGQIGIFRK
jgi:hypothetical protein